MYGCGFFDKKKDIVTQEEQGEPLARVYTKYLYPNEIEGIEGKNYSKEDSAALVEKYIENWVLQQLLLLKAEAQVDETAEEIQKKIMECRNTLMVHEFEKEYLRKTLDTAVAEKEIRSYYDSNINHFELKQNIIKGIFIKVPKDAPDLNKVRSLLKSGNASQSEELRSFCVRFASRYVLEDSIWINFDETIQNTPYMSIPDKGDFLERHRYSEQSDDRYLYFLKIKDYKISKEISPFEFVKDQIRTTLLNRRKIALINNLKNTIYQEAQNKKDFEIYSEK